MKKKILIIQTGNAYPKFYENDFNFSDMIIKGCGRPAASFLTIDVFEDGMLPDDFDKISGVVITGSKYMVTDRLPWMIRTESWLKKAREHQIPILGICFGHQLLAQAFGGVVGNHPEGTEVGTVLVDLTNRGQKDPLLEPLKASFLGYVSHTQSVLKLPDDAELLAKNHYEPHHCFKLPPHVYGVQFHPEFTEEVIAEGIRTAKEEGAIKYLSPEDRHRASVGIESGYIVLKQFVKLCETIQQEKL